VALQFEKNGSTTFDISITGQAEASGRMTAGTARCQQWDEEEQVRCSQHNYTSFPLGSLAAI